MEHCHFYQNIHFPNKVYTSVRLHVWLHMVIFVQNKLSIKEGCWINDGEEADASLTMMYRLDSNKHW